MESIMGECQKDGGIGHTVGFFVYFGSVVGMCATLFGGKRGGDHSCCIGVGRGGLGSDTG